MENSEDLLKVENQSQYFGPTKAVDNVSFDIKKGEVFGLGGESGCGKTTTGRSVIKIYDITSGFIYFKGQRICAGAKSYRDEIKAQRAVIAQLKKTKPADMAERIAACNERIAQMKEEIKKAEFAHKNCDKEYAKTRIAEVKAEYEPKLAAATGEELAEQKRKYKADLHVAKYTKLIS